MTSTADNNQPVTATQPPPVSSTGPKAGSTSPLPSLANATEPKNLSSNQQQSPVATFPERKSNGSPTVYLNASEGTILLIPAFVSLG